MIEWCDVEITLRNLFQMNRYRLAKCRTLFELASQVSGPIIELGTYRGMTAIAMASVNDKVYTVDDYLPKHGWSNEFYEPKDKEVFKRNIRNAGVEPTLILMSIDEAATQWSVMADMIFWDTGCDNVLIEHFRQWSKFVNRDGLFLVHDTQDYRLGWLDLMKYAGDRWQVEDHYPMHGLRKL